ncbi:MAG: hypothetical protein DMG30_13260 [Acidobacteria bacterium]|nr:MAG: hypothetical protein DMG30_13260 [Acidobacteriota bacterium]
MLIFLRTLFASLLSIFRLRAALELENLALRHQIAVLQRTSKTSEIDLSRPVVRQIVAPFGFFYCRLILRQAKDAR